MRARASGSTDGPAASPAAIAFRPLERRDLGRLHDWLNEPEVVRWFSHASAPSLRQVERKYGPRIAGDSPTRVFVVTIDGADAGIAQTYRLEDYPDFAAGLGSAPDWAGIDYLLGEPSVRGRGLAHRVIRAFVGEVVFAEPDTQVCAALPASGNMKSIRALARAGFVHEREVELEPGSVDCLMLTRCRGT